MRASERDCKRSSSGAALQPRSQLRTEHVLGESDQDQGNADDLQPGEFFAEENGATRQPRYGNEQPEGRYHGRGIAVKQPGPRGEAEQRRAPSQHQYGTPRPD